MRTWFYGLHKGSQLNYWVNPKNIPLWKPYRTRSKSQTRLHTLKRIQTWEKYPARGPITASRRRKSLPRKQPLKTNFVFQMLSDSRRSKNGYRVHGFIYVDSVNQSDPKQSRPKEHSDQDTSHFSLNLVLIRPQQRSQAPKKNYYWVAEKVG